ncbi:F-box/kelch-repeat protein At3g06240-like [Rhododendron vialii]|uniref:F-box/kelch-repeat protein At3g06240-like n=1 Tax=Rhododendron vialii TaxID=182163 RepID=UPI00265ECCE0|nr:F-box/kelch-repeat protein At3g06240-like [Rhododendron vialii]XP_058198200.1 F-box/kelch-repeat protein At3g06240-like [Rhododendron vialii]XP_058198208.1 F-box/kelch-repeat protein At3g06240-like [Rhododendron vialii]XP_058198215.1 F-box/kelch-repeat protein At3g06240-like [Rhododendron vialii]XP_058198223.1 F-box/kelch-repeat protein At3g06240-like [Rhododendron vialii]XP_058198230.1 F-box/kelch-repeat protein At3g06240-like [Rhododendron vialii]
MSDCGTLIPQEILTDILSRLPVKSLCRFKCVSPSWNSLISNPYFAKTHLNRTNTRNPQYLDQRNIVISSSLNLYSIDFGDANPTATELDFPTVEQHAADKQFKVWSSCDGLLLVSYNDNFNFFLLNPSTRKCKKLPGPPFVLNPVCTWWYAYGVGYDSSTDDYNVVMLSCNDIGSAQSNISIVDVYSLKTNAWRRIQHTHYVAIGTAFSCGGVFLNGCLHWLCWRNGTYVIGAFNLSDQIFREVPMPASLRGGCGILRYFVEVVGGCLCLVERRPSYKSDVWKMEEYGVGESWTNLTIDLPTGTPSLCLLCQLAEDKLLFANSRRHGKKLVVYDLKKETLRDVVVAGIPSEFTFRHAYVESLVSPILGGGIGRQ